MADRRPCVFVGSSAEGLPIAKAIQINLDRACEVVIWSQGVFGLSGGTLEALVEKAGEFDFAVLVITPDDMTQSRGNNQQSPRDNVLLELGLFIGVLGRKRSFVVYDRSAKTKLPTDLAGVTNAGYQPHSSGNHQSSVGAACSQIEDGIKQLGLRDRCLPAIEIDTNTHFQTICGLLEPCAQQFVILMHEYNVSLHRDAYGNGAAFTYGMSTRAAGQGYFSVDNFCSRLPDAGLLEQNLRNNITLTDRGHKFSIWLINNGYKSAYFKSYIGSWGEESANPFPGPWPPWMGHQQVAPTHPLDAESGS